MTYARVQDGIVRELFPEKPDFVPEIMAMIFQCPPETVEGWTYDGHTFSTAPASVPLSYAVRRRSAYPPIGDQLDALWHAMDTGVIPKIEPMYTACRTVKLTYPKS